MTTEHGVGVELRRSRVCVGSVEIDGWAASFDGTVAVGHGREEALRKLVVNVAQEAL